MNPERIVYGRVTINDEKQTLGRGAFALVIQRLMQQYATKRYQGEKLRIIIEICDDPLGAESLMSREMQLEQEFRALHTEPSDEEIYPGVTMARIAEVMMDELYDVWSHLCKAANRIGVAESYITETREAYRIKYPDVYPHTPIWQDR